jgi:hypothetical protein
MTSTKQRINFRYVLGNIVDGRTHIYTGLGEFPSADAADAYCRSQPRNGAALIFEEWDCVKYGVVYGSGGKFVRTAGI